MKINSDLEIDYGFKVGVNRESIRYSTDFEKYKQ